MGSDARYAILDGASDEACLWELPLGVVELRDEQRIEVHPVMSIAELRAELVQLLRTGDVQMLDIRHYGGQPLSLDDALNVVGDDRNWESPLTRGELEAREHVYHLICTETGTDELSREHSQRQ